MDVYEGRFRGNGACGYVLKPSVMREQIAVFCANSRDSIPGVAPQLLKIKVISGQCLPNPEAQQQQKHHYRSICTSSFWPPADCSEAKTRTVSDDGNFPVFDESFDFGKAYATAFQHGEPIDNATLFWHIFVSSKKEGNLIRLGEKKSKATTSHSVLKVKDAVSALSSAEQSQQSVETAWCDLQEECGLDYTANVKQCIKVVIMRFLSQPGNPTLSIVKENDVEAQLV
ncbi:Zinc transporter ZIP13-like protein [Armadillidium vulgare]|nr:Zinc transporter ZIP13-like protein [Armadillidium vulgare]